jgi:hypothetical protein
LVMRHLTFISPSVFAPVVGSHKAYLGLNWHLIRGKLRRQPSLISRLLELFSKSVVQIEADL